MISSSTCSKCSRWRRCWPAASSATSTETRCTRCWKRRRGWPKVRWRNPSPTPTVIPRHSIPRRTRSACPSRSRSHSGPGSRGIGSGSGSTKTSAVCRRPRWSPGRSTSFRSAPSPRPSSIRRARFSRTSCTTSATSNNGTWRRWPSSATGAPPWCSPNPTRDPTSAPGGRRRSSSPTAPGTSTASNDSSPTATPTTCSRTSCIWCWPGPRVPDRAPRV